jgi:hypothetical protein
MVLIVKFGDLVLLIELLLLKVFPVPSSKLLEEIVLKLSFLR